MNNAEEIIIKLINEKKITGEEAMTLFKAIGSEKTIEKYIYRDHWSYPYVYWTTYPGYTTSTTSLPESTCISASTINYDSTN
jgi:hypothetical protein